MTTMETAYQICVTSVQDLMIVQTWMETASLMDVIALIQVMVMVIPDSKFVRLPIRSTLMYYS